MTLSRTIDTPDIDSALAVKPTPRKHVLDLDDFSQEEIAGVLESARSMKEVLGRDIKKSPSASREGGCDTFLRVQHPHQGIIRRSREGAQRRCY